MNEIWKPVVGWEGLYNISNLGRVKSLSRFVSFPNGGGYNKLESILKPSFNKLGYARVNFYLCRVRKSYQIHRLVGKHFVNLRWKGEFDHKDNNPSNNKWSNLRPASRSQQGANSRKRRNCSSKYKGVCFCKQTNKWRVIIQKNGKRINLGRFVNEEEAALVYNEAAIKYFGEFAHINEV